MADGEVHDVSLDLQRGGAVDLSLQYTPLAETSFEEIQARRGATRRSPLHLRVSWGSGAFHGQGRVRWSRAGSG